MKIIRFQDPEGKIGHAALQDDGTARVIDGDIYGARRLTEKTATVATLLAPIAPTAILGVGLNYHAHAMETGAPVPSTPVLFCKGINSCQHPGDAIVLPTHLRSDEVDYECELAVVIGTACKNVPRARALEYVLGYTCCNDVSARDWQLKRGGGQWCRGKTFDTFSPLGPCLVTPDEIPNPNALRLRTILNGTVMQDSRTSDMIFDVATIIEFLSGSTTLLPGTVILTGTPQGVGMAQKPPRWLTPGDRVSIEIERIGTLTNPVRREVVADAAAPAAFPV